MQATYLANLVLIYVSQLITLFIKTRSLYSLHLDRLCDWTFRVQEILAFRWGYVPEKFRERQNRDARR